jgi:hypothetical protein
MDQENVEQMEVDEIVPDFVCRVIYQDKHLYYEDI